MDIRLLRGAEIEPHIDDLARLRIQVFREFPYLYDGNLDYEAEYLATYVRSADSLCVLVRDEGRVVGASTALPLADETEEFQQPFIAAGWNPARIFYCAESVVLPAWRGRGLGVRFFVEREVHARKLGGFDWCAFCAVQRPVDHPRRPADYQPLDAFWARRGYRHHPELRTYYHWRDLDEAEESAKPMSFWLKELAS
ncbi:GNAT family N-acetyltransferase [Ectopseudomonas oleovorans]|uniref:GNAT family N-acetyltransferase n=1 Tax=Ectopseudomonas oleovorans TaxID=301 RepID=A0AA42Q801_ECTOL|nr:GNAT family N-acetyltransferase [Pseudomonas oleovorans]MDH1338006.1 GNAT family N-acetyltransferase [Pseudomonas oleovorans]MDH1491029.1 GNAT family N-acetyltransferase [Pseudomonas oleovorans]WGG19944.1 GNAT family N-acetyltransferase [Pseudomonas oleovorans]